MIHQTFDPSPSLAPLVKSYWNLESPKAQTPERNTIVPDGSMKMIFHYADPYRHYTPEGEMQALPRCLVVGQLTRPYEVEPTGDTGTFMVCFQPNGFLPFASTPVKEMLNTTVAVEEVFGESGKVLCDAILSAKSVADRIERVEAFLLARVTDKSAIDHVLRSTVETIITANGQISVGELSSKPETSRRQLERKFSSAIGLSPKQLSKIIRLQAALKMMLDKDYTSLTTLAYDNEYFDQAHFNKDFKEFTGLTPKEFYGDDLKMSLIFDGRSTEIGNTEHKKQV